MSQRPSRSSFLPGVLTGAVSGAVAMFLLYMLADSSLTLAVAVAVVVAGAGGAIASSLLRRGTAGANIAGLSALAGVMLAAILFGADSALTGTQTLLFGIALAFVCAMAGQITASR